MEKNQFEHPPRMAFPCLVFASLTLAQALFLPVPNAGALSFKGTSQAPPNRPLLPKDFENGERLPEKLAKGSEETSGKFEGDIVFGGKKLGYYLNPMKSFRTAFGNERLELAKIGAKWPKRKVPYYISPDFNDYERSRIAKAISVFHNKTCIRFMPGTVESDYLYIVKGDGCWSFVGPQGGRQELSVGSGCTSSGIIQHELMHTLGFFHEQSRPDRDKYIRVNFDNIKPKKERNFKKYQVNTVDTLGTPYDYGSVMHYGTHAFSKNGRPTIVTINEATIGQRDGLSEQDIRKVNTFYECKGAPTCDEKYPGVCQRLKFWCFFELLQDICCSTCASNPAMVDLFPGLID